MVGHQDRRTIDQGGRGSDMNATSRPPERARRTQNTRPAVSRRTMIATTIAVLTLLVGVSASLAAGFLTHRVQSGDTLSELALDYGLTVEELAALNDIDDPDLIIVDDDLLIRPLQDGDDLSQATETHIVMSGDTLSGIALSLGVSVEALAAANGLANPDLIVTGDLLRVPMFDGSPAPATVEAPDNTEVAPQSTGQDEDVEETGPVLITSEIQAPTPADAVQAGSATLHLVLPGETVASIAATYGVTTAQLLAANGHARNGISTGMILKIPPQGTSSVQLVGMPTATEVSAVGSELTAVSVATSYWGSAIPEASILEMLDQSLNPHFGFRGDVNGVYGGTDDYGVYAGPLAEVIAAQGFVGDVFYADGDPTALTNRIDSGLPVVVWMTFQTAVVTPERIDDGVRPFTVVPEKQAAVVYGYDDQGVLIVDVASGGYAHVNWTDFMRSWNYFDGMGLAISPI
jgi:LysM repeat protein